MLCAIAEANDVTADVYAHAAIRRGHQAMAVPGPDRLLGHLPFTPTTVIVSLPVLDAKAKDALRGVRAHFPEATLIVVYERANGTSPTALLQAGVDETVKAPIPPHELILRAESWERARASAAPGGQALQIGDLEVDLNKYAVRKNDTNVVLTRLELRLLYCLCEHYPHLAPSERLLTFGWEGMEEPDVSLIKTHISHIRKKLDATGGTHVDIRSRQGVGYTLSIGSA